MTEPLNPMVRAWVEASCAAQGVSVKIADRVVLSAVAELLGVRQVERRSDAPDGADAGGVEAVVTATTGLDDRVVDNCGDDGVLGAER
jgi:hypothetical protein